jgi:capsular polysaccharide biosynthesis protein
VLGRNLDGHVVPLPSDTPRYVLDLISNIVGISEERVRFYDVAGEALLFKKGIYPTFCNERGLHSIAKDIYTPFTRRITGYPDKLYISRRNLCGTSSAQRSFPRRRAFEEILEKLGFTAIFPESLSLRHQIEAFGSAQYIVGEFGSGMHTAVFSRPNTVVGVYQMLNPIQLRIAECFRHKSVYLFPSIESDLGLPTYESDVESSLINDFAERVLGL